MDELRVKIALAYKLPRVTKFIDDDVKLIKRLNQVLVRLERHEKEKYILESMNIIRQLDNVFNLNKLYSVMCEMIDIRFHSTILFLYEQINNPDVVVKKLQGLIRDE